jgi:pimeloyl-ACP methyl ester carboxylesterase
MGTRLEIENAVANWDPDDNAEMGPWTQEGRRTIMSKLNVTTTAKVEDEFDSNTNLVGVSVDPLGDIRKRPRLKQLAVGTQPRATNSRALGNIEAVVYKQRGWGGVVWSFYGEILMELAEKLNPAKKAGEDHPVYAFGYDWRQSNTASGKLLKDRIAKLKQDHKAEKVIIVSHSMGGLVTRSALAQGAMDDVLGVIHTVIPADGAVVAYRRFFTGANTAAEGKEDPIAPILGETRLEYGLTQSVLRGPVELLPHASYPDIFFKTTDGTTNRDVPNLFPAYASSIAPGFLYKKGEKFDPGVLSSELQIEQNDVDNLRQKILDAGKFAQTIVGVAHPNTALILGDLLVTDMMVDFSRAKLTATGAGAEAIAIKQKAGDGTVPAPSARFLTVKNPRARIGVKGAEHAACFSAPGFIGFVLKAVQDLVANPKPP